MARKTTTTSKQWRVRKTAEVPRRVRATRALASSFLSSTQSRGKNELRNCGGAGGYATMSARGSIANSTHTHAMYH